MADVSGTGEVGQSTDRDAEQRVGLGLLSRFIGAVFLVLLGGLLLLDRAVSSANEKQSELDVKAGALLTESFVITHDALLDRVAAVVVARREPRDSALLRADVARLLGNMASVRRVWVTSPDGRRLIDVAGSAANTGSPLSPALVDSVDRAAPRTRATIGVIRRPESRDTSFRSALIAIVRPMTAVEVDRLEELLRPAPRAGLAWYRATLRQGWKRQLRRMFGAVEAPIERLVRVRIGPVRIDGLPSGRVRPLKAPEVRGLASGGGRSREVGDGPSSDAAPSLRPRRAGSSAPPGPRRTARSQPAQGDRAAARRPRGPRRG